MSGKRVLVHVGTPKTGTSHLQDVLFRNRDELSHHGILYPAERFDAELHLLHVLSDVVVPAGRPSPELRTSGTRKYCITPITPSVML